MCKDMFQKKKNFNLIKNRSFLSACSQSWHTYLKKKFLSWRNYFIDITDWCSNSNCVFLIDIYSNTINVYKYILILSYNIKFDVNQSKNF